MFLLRWALVLLLGSLPAWGQSTSTPLTLLQARTLLASTGVGVGKIFVDDPSASSPNRYLVARINSHLVRPNVFTIEIEIQPLAKVGF